MGKLAEAQKHFTTVVQVQIAKLGPNHANTLTTKNNLAALLETMGENTQARVLFEEVVAGRTGMFQM